MNRQTSRTVAFAVLFLACLRPGGSLAQGGQTLPTTALNGRVEPQVLAQLDTRGTAGYLVYLNERPDLSPAYQMGWIDRGRFVAKALQEAASRSQAAVRAYLDAQGVPYEAFWIENVIAVEPSGRATLEGLLQFPEVKAVRARRRPIVYEPVDGEPAGTVRAEMAPTSVQPNLSHVGADLVWAMGYTGQGVVVANIDTGVRYTHEALFPHYRGNDGDHSYDWWDPYGDHPAAPADEHGHGTHTMGIMVGEDVSKAHQIGMAPGAQWIACRGCDFSNCADAALLECAEFVIAPWDLAGANSNPDLRPNVVNNSWGDCSRSYDGWFQEAVDNWQAAGIYPVFSNGNSINCGYPMPPGCNTVGNPARYGNVTGVGSTGQSDGQYAWHSNWGPTDAPDTVNEERYPGLKPQVLAPGVSILSSVRTSDTAYESWMGTSMSAPAVSGLVALMWSACPWLAGDYANTESIIQDTATRIAYASNCGGEGLGNVPNMATGWGEIDALAAVQTATNWCSRLGDLHGTVLGSPPLEAVGGAVVTARRQEGGTWQRTSDTSGYYTMTVPSGTFTVTVEHPAYSTVMVTGVGVETSAVTTQDFQLERWGVLQGHVLDADSGAPLQATLSTGDGTSTATDPATGYYEMVLDAGTYQVSAEAIDYASQTESIQVGAGVTTVQDFLLQAAISVVPEPIAVALELGQEGSASAAMTNNMAVSYPFQFVEIEGDLPEPLSWCLRYPGALPCDTGAVPWYGTSIRAGTLAAGDTLVWTNYFTATAAAGIDQPGEYHAWLQVLPDDPGGSGLPVKDVPVVLTVLPPPTMGKLEGLVTSDRPGGPLAAEILIEGGDGLSHTVVSDPLGFYVRWLPVGGYTLTATAEGYLTASAQVEIEGLQTTSRNFELVLDAPKMDVTPLALDARMSPDSQITGSLSIANDGVSDLTWEICDTASAVGEGDDLCLDEHWVSEVPTSGVTLPGTASYVDVILDSTSLSAGACYTASLGLVHDDPGWEMPLRIPVHLCVAQGWPRAYLPVITRAATP